ncbi:MAG: AAA family ATPase [Burkholderiales bacterium]|nr:AAA family ATPase [Burkholderiales bacterium]
MIEGAERIIDLLTYIEQVEKLKAKPPFEIPRDAPFLAHQHEMATLPDVAFNLQVDGDDVWLRFPRLQEIAPPELDDALKPWVTLPKSPEKTPELRAELVIYEGREVASRISLTDHPEIREAFDWYVEFQWTPWASAERPRRRAIACYTRLFALHQTIASEGAETPLELAWGIGYAAWKKVNFGTALTYPLIVQACEVTLNEKTFELEVRPRSTEPRLEVDCFAEMDVAGVPALEATWRTTLATAASRINPFEPGTYDGMLKAAVSYLDPAGTYETRASTDPLPRPGDKLHITNNWVLFARKRSGDIFLEDIRRLKAKVGSATALPSVIRKFVEHGGDTVRVQPEQPYRGLSTSDGGTNAMELYFPMAYNDEQVSIVQKLHHNDGVVVQGPPGTGKTHTIANVICHYLAQGKRVLVTAKGESALAVLQEKLPEGIRPLSVALLSDERDGMKQFEHAIQAIASSVASINPTRSAATITAAEAKLNHLHAKISHVDQSVAAHALRHMETYAYQGRSMMPEELARLALEQAEQHQWFDDEPPAKKDGVLPVDDAALNGLRRARLMVGTDIAYLGFTLPAVDAFPLWSDLVGLHRDLVKAKAIDSSVLHGSTLALVDAQLATFEKAQALVEFLDDRMTLKSKLVATRAPWLEVLSKRIADLQPVDPVLQSLLAVCEEVRKLERERRELVGKAVSVPPEAEQSVDFTNALVRLVAGKSAFAMPFGLGQGDTRKLVAAVTVQGVEPAGRPEWELVEQAVAWRLAARKVLARWAALAGEFGLESGHGTVDDWFRLVAHWESTVEDVRKLRFDFDAHLHDRLAEVFGRPVADKMWEGGEVFVANAFASLQAHLDKSRLAYALRRVQELLRLLDGHQGGVVEELRGFLAESLSRPTADEGVLQTTWQALQAELARLTLLLPSLAEIDRVTAALSAAGATRWAAKLRTQAAVVDTDPLTPPTWAEAWAWRQAVMFLDSIDGHHTLRGLFEERKQLTTTLARTYQELVAEKTWLGVFNNSPDSVRQALQAYLNAVQAMGSGTGVRAVRHRRTARDAMTRAYQAVPCWVLPHWRVSETIPPEVGLFDLVVIDEASQSDIWALPALLRGRKVLVVGDHKQVSPSAVGLAETKIKELETRFLGRQPHGSEMTPDKSIYDLARVVFAGNSVMLKEHFRCVSPIIEFSNREFYQGDIRPLRVPKANERLDPPLVDVFVKGGIRKGDVNEGEAQAIIDEIRAILRDPQFDGRSIGVVTLLGTSQAARINELVTNQISQGDIVARRIAVGPPPVFQGRERDIMMVSMVLAPGDRTAANKADIQQRINVAMSRARDRMYLFRSVPDNQFSEDSLSGRIIRHFQQPFQRDAKKVQSLRDLCESGFEREMFDELVKRGYRVQPQVPCGGYRMDFVVEGNEGRRLAVECDGDRFHGPGQWQDDMGRQRVLERAGWTFWRCFASSFVRRRDDVMQDLLATLHRLGIEPLGADVVDNSVWVHHKEVDPLGVEADEEVDEQEVT